MPVILTPATAPTVPCCEQPVALATLTPVDVLAQNVRTAPITRLNGVELLSRLRAITLQQGQCATINWIMQAEGGAPLDLTAIETLSSSSSATLDEVPDICDDLVPAHWYPGHWLSPCSVEPVVTADVTVERVIAPEYRLVFRLKEHIQRGGPGAFQAYATIVNAATGEITVDVPEAVTHFPGVYFGEIALLNVNRTAQTYCLITSNTFYVVINRGNFAPSDCGGPPSLMEIRLHLRDSNASESFLLDSLRFDTAELALAIARPVEYWNEIPPPVRQFTTNSFPYRFHWLDGICGQLFFMVAEQFRANQLEYSAAGLSVNDQNKEANYERAGQLRWESYKAFVRSKKAELNLAESFGEVGSPYGYGYLY